MERLVRLAQDAPGRYGFAVLGETSGEVRRSTWFYDVVHEQQRCEIGNTYYGRQLWGGPTNPACKPALLTQAFDVWGMYRVALRADSRNSGLFPRRCPAWLAVGESSVQRRDVAREVPPAGAGVPADERGAGAGAGA